MSKTPRASDKKWLVAKSILALLLVYAFGSWSVDSGSFWHYLLTLVFLVIAVKALVQLFKK